MKTCTSCGNELPDTLEYFPPAKQCRNGRNPKCRSCVLKQQRQWKAANKDRLAHRRRELYAAHYGPIHQQKERERKQRIPFISRARIMRQGMKDRAKAKQLPFDGAYFTAALLVDWFLRTPTCPCCGVALDYGYKPDKAKKDNSPSADRIHPERGYVKGNVVIICWRCNNLKRDATPDELFTVANWMKSVW